ncbi:MAG TPA: NDP-sugar synthase [Candidatus Binataceae bacterium]|nr:NDP-sugar synthase [Candidatus Binataceae bacterium]
MQALVFVDRPGKALMPLTERTCAALLPVVGKPLVVFALEDLAFAGIREALVIASAHADRLEQELGNGARWGMRLEYVLVRPNESPDQVVRKVAGQLSEHFLMMRGDLLRTPLLKKFLALAMAGRQPAEAVYGGRPAAIRLATQSDQASWQLMADPEQSAASPATLPLLDLPEGNVSLIASLAQYHRANIDAAAGRFGALIVPGREVAPGVRLGRQSRLPATAIKGTCIFVGSRCRIDHSAEIMNEVVLNDDVIIDRQSTLRCAVILPHTYVGEMVDVCDSIVSTNYLISVSTGAVTRVVDSFLLSGLKRTGYTTGFASLMHRCLGLLALLISAPLWPLMFLASIISRPTHPFRRVRLVGNKLDRAGGIERRKIFVTLEGATPVPALKWLPLLLAVLGGNLRMIGVEAMPPEREAMLEADWERLREEAPVGLIGPTRLALGPEAPDEEKRVAEGYYARVRSEWNDIAMLGAAVRALFKTASWIPATGGGSYPQREVSKA